MNIHGLIKMFEKGSVMVCGQRGSGKDVLFSNVIAYRNKEYVSNVPYGYSHIPLCIDDLNVPLNYDAFIKGTDIQFNYPYPQKADIYISDAGIYLPSQFNEQLNKKYPGIPTFLALSRHFAECNVHINTQSLNRVWDKLREQCDQYIMCRGCYWLGNIVFIKIRIYELYDSCIARKPPFRTLSKPRGKEAREAVKIERSRYELMNGKIRDKILIIYHKGRYDTRHFRKYVRGGGTR